MFKSVFIKNFKIIFICFCFILNKCYSEDCCEICYNCCCNCLNSKNKKTSVSDNTNKEKFHTYNNKKSETNSEKEEEEKGNNKNEENEVGEDLGYKYKKQANKGKKKLNTILEEGEEEEKEESEEEEENGSNEKEKNDEINNDKYLEEVLENFNNVKVIKGDFFKAQNNYELEKSGTIENDGVLGNGAYGCVYKIKKNNGRIFVLKQIVEGEDYPLKDIQKEIQNLIRLKDEQNILRIVDVYRQNNFIGNFLENEYSKEKNATCFYIITEYCKGGDLGYLITNEGGEYDKNKIAVYVCHQKQIAHLDLKPENFFLSDNLNIKLGDFGVSSYFEKNAKYDKKCGTIGYISYDVFSGKEYDPFKADLFSLGATLYRLYIEEFLYNIEEELLYNIENNEVIKKIDGEFNKITKIIDSIQDIKLKTLLKGLLTKLEKDRWGWDDIFDSDFYKELNEKYNNK